MHTNLKPFNAATANAGTLADSLSPGVGLVLLPLSHCTVGRLDRQRFESGAGERCWFFARLFGRSVRLQYAVTALAALLRKEPE